MIFKNIMVGVKGDIDSIFEKKKLDKYQTLISHVSTCDNYTQLYVIVH